MAENQIQNIIISEDTDQKPQKPRKKTSGIRRLIKICLIILGILAVMLIAGWITFRATVQAPEIPSINLPDEPAAGGMFIPLDNGDETESPAVGSGLRAPLRFTDDNRRQNVFTFLIIGLNTGQNANTIMVASYDTISREANLVSIPRDVPVHATRNGRKLSSSFIIGSNRGGGIEGGVERVQRDVMSVIGFIPDFYVLIDYDAFFTIIDAVGGIDIYVPIRMRYDDPVDNLRIDIQPGQQLMDGETALHFVRFRQANRNSGYPDLPGGDLGRIKNQQAVVAAVTERLLRPASLLRIPEFISIFNKSVHTDLSVRNITWAAEQLFLIRGTDALSGYTLPVSHSGFRNDISYEYLDPAGVLELVNRTINPFYEDIEPRDLNIIRD